MHFRRLLLLSTLVLSAAVVSSATTTTKTTPPKENINDIAFTEQDQYYLDVVSCEITEELKSGEGGGSCWYAVAADIAAQRHELTRRLVALTKLQAEFMRRGQVSPDAVSIRAKATFLDMLAIALRDSSNIQIPMEIAELRDHSPPLVLSSLPFSNN